MIELDVVIVNSVLNVTVTLPSVGQFFTGIKDTIDSNVTTILADNVFT